MPDKGDFLAVGDASLGWAVASSRAGSSHLRSVKPCQDAYAIWSGSVAGEACLIAAVADGHGDDRHDQSQFGAALAVRVAIDELFTLQTNFGGSGLSARLASNFKSDFPRRIGKRWREAVIADASFRLADTMGDHHDDSAILRRYGTTLLAAIVVGNMLLVGQIGDGEVLIVRQGNSVDFPLAGQSEDAGIVTDSLCSEGAFRLWRTASLDCAQGCLILLATDGLVNAFADDTQLDMFARSMRERVIEHGLVNVANSLPGWLDYYSDRGSGDDITLALLQVNPDSQRLQRSSPSASVGDFGEHSQENADVSGDRPTGICGDIKKQSPDTEKIG